MINYLASYSSKIAAFAKVDLIKRYGSPSRTCKETGTRTRESPQIKSRILIGFRA